MRQQESQDKEQDWQEFNHARLPIVNDSSMCLCVREKEREAQHFGNKRAQEEMEARGA